MSQSQSVELTKSELKKIFPRLYELKIPIYQNPTYYVKWDEVRSKLNDDEWDRFGELFGIQTQFVDGPYASDVEAVLERMKSIRLTGSQLLWD